MNTGKVTRINETEEVFNYQDKKFSIVELELNGSENFVWAKWESTPMPNVNDFIEYENNGKDKQGRDKVKGVKIQSVRLMENTGTTSADEARQVYIARSVALDHAVKFVDMTKNKTVPENPFYGTEYTTRVVHVANLFFDFLYRGNLPEFTPPAKEEGQASDEEGKKPVTRRKTTEK
jgi:hypothetical protein